MLGCPHGPGPSDAPGMTDGVMEPCLSSPPFPLGSIGDRAKDSCGFHTGWAGISLDCRVAECLEPAERRMARIPEARRRCDKRTEERIGGRWPLSAIASRDGRH